MRWGLVGHGAIAPKFLDAARGVGHEVLTVVGRDPNRTRSFGLAHGIAEATVDPSCLVDQVEAVYVATPHSQHCEIALALLRAGVPVLCEKPMAVNHAQVVEMTIAASDTGTFLMEAMWTRHLPIYETVSSWIKNERIGSPKLVEASLGIRAPYDLESRLWSPSLAGGSLLDVGIYPLTFADMVLGSAPQSVAALAELSPEGIDAHLAMVLAYPGGALARLGSAISMVLSAEARITGELGTITVPEFLSAEVAFLEAQGKTEEVRRPHRVNGFEYQILEVERCLMSGLVESPVVPWSWSLKMANLMDTVRAQIGVGYPFEKKNS